MRRHLNEKLIDSLEVVRGERIEVQDQKVVGLVVRVYGQRDGSKSIVFYWRRHQAGRNHVRQLGRRTPGVFGVQEARSEATKLNGMLEARKLDSKPKKNVPTLSQAYERFRKHEPVGRVSQTTLDGYDWLASLWADLGDVKINRVRPADVKDLHARLGAQVKKGGKPQHRTANRAVQLLSRVWETAADEGLAEGRNPCRGVKRFRESVRRRVLTADEFARVFEALQHEDRDIRDLFEVLIFTGSRKGAACAMRFADVDGATWTVPVEKSKNRRPITIQLVPRLVALIQRRRKTVVGDYVFPPRRSDSKSPHLVNVRQPWERICKRAGITGATPHDLRRSWATLALGNGMPERVISDGLGHSNQQSVDSYAHSTADAVRRATEAVAAALEEATNK